LNGSGAGTPGWALAFRLARRELRGGLTGFRIFLACLTLGVAAIAGVGSLSQAIVEGLEADARRLLGGDVSVRLLNHPADARQMAFLSQAGKMSLAIEMRAMARVRGGAKRTLVELKGVDDVYPLVDEVRLEGGGQLDKALAKTGNVWGAAAEPGLLSKLNLNLGDEISVGDGIFKISAVIAREPDRVANLLSFGPRLMVAAGAIDATGLILPGSQVRYRYRIILDGESADSWIDKLNQAFPAAGWRVRGASEAAPGLRQFIDRLTLFLTFVGLTTLLVGGVGITNAVSSYLDGRIRTIATLKCLGAPGGLIFKTYFLQIMALTGIGLVAGLVLGAILPAAAASALEGRLPIAVATGIQPMALFIAAVFGILVSITFALWPLARARDIPAANLFRAKVQPLGGRPRRSYVLVTGLFTMVLAALTIWTATDKWFAVWFVAGAMVSLLLLSGGAWVVMNGAKRIKGIRRAETRLAISNLHRPGAATSSVVTSLGLGLAVLIAIALIEGNLSRQIDERIPAMAPAFFFLDIQSDQVDRFDKAMTGFDGTGDYKRVATLRARITQIGGVDVAKAKIGAGSSWAVHGDRVVTYATEPADNAIITKGKWWPTDYRGPPLISLDAHVAGDFGVEVGDTLTLNVLGRNISARIASLREIDWRSMRFDFAIIFSPGILENAPQTHIAAIQAPKSLEQKIERAVGDQFENVSIIRVREALQSAADILAGIGGAVRATAAITILAGALVLAGVVAAGRRRRVYDAVVFKVLGATRAVILRAFLIEYGLLGLTTAIISTVIGTATAWAIVTLLMRMRWSFSGETVLITAGACLILTLFAGFAGTWWALGQKSAPLLRNE